MHQPVAGKLILKSWLMLLVTTLGVTYACIRWIDEPIALYFLKYVSPLSGLGRAFGSAILVSGEITLVVFLSLARILRGSLPLYAKALFIACCASLSAYAANSFVLKLFFSRQTPLEFLRQPDSQVFHFFQGSQYSSFPSGHMVMASAFAFAIIRLYPRTWPPLTALLCLGAILLVIGDFHFLSDVVAGAFVGGTAGFLAGELWRQHTQLHAHGRGI